MQLFLPSNSVCLEYVYHLIRFTYIGPFLQPRQLFPQILTLNWICCCNECIFRTIKLFCADQNEVLKNFAVVKRVDCIMQLLPPVHNESLIYCVISTSGACQLN